MTELRPIRTTIELNDAGALRAPVVPVIPSNIIEFELCRQWRDNRNWLTALGCPDRAPIIEGGHLTFLDLDRTLSIAHSAPGLSRLVWATAGGGIDEARYASFELPDGEIVSLDLQPGHDLWVSFSHTSYEEAVRLAAWLDACRTFDLQYLIQGAA